VTPVITTAICAGWLTLLGSAGPPAGDPAVTTAVVRPLDEPAAALVAAARERSQTVRDLLDELSRSDLVVYVRFSVALRPPRATTTLVNARGPVRFIAVTLSMPNPLTVNIEMLGHELTHAVEIARNPQIRTQADLAWFYQTHGRTSRHCNGFDSDEAVAIQRRIRREVG
jgi:hypothetical protein